MDPSEHLRGLEGTTDPALLIPALEELGTFICIGMEEYVRAFDINRGTTVLLGIVKKCKEEAVHVLAYRCLALILENMPHASEVLTASGATPMIVKSLSEAHCMELIEELLKVLREISIDDSSCVLLQAGAVPAIISSMDRQDRRLHPTSIATLQNIVSKINLEGTQHLTPRRGLGRKAKAHAPPPPSASMVADTIRKEIIPSLQSLLETLFIQDLDQNGTREVTIALCSCMCALLERCSNSIAGLAETIVKAGFVRNFASLLQSANLQGDARQQGVLLKCFGVLCSVSPSAMVPELLSDPHLIPLLANTLVPADQDFSSTLRDPFGSQQEAERISGGGQAKSTTDLRSDVVYLVHCMASPVAPSLLHKPLPSLQRTHQWEWEDDFHAFTPYDMNSQLALEQAFQAGQSQVTIHVRSSAYTCDLAGMKQINPGSGVSRNIIRHPIPMGYRRNDEATVVPSKEEKKKPEKEEKKDHILKRISSRRSSKPTSSSTSAPSPSSSSSSSSSTSTSSSPELCESLEPPPQRYSLYTTEKGAELAATMLGGLAGSFAQYATQCQDMETRATAVEVLAQLVYTAVVSSRAVQGRYNKLLTEALEKSISRLLVAFNMLVSKGDRHHTILDLTLLSIGLTTTINEPVVAPQLRRSGLRENLRPILSPQNKTPPPLLKRAQSLCDTYLRSVGPEKSEERLKTLTRSIAGNEPGALENMLQKLTVLADDTHHAELHTSGLVSDLLEWLSSSDFAVRHQRYGMFTTALRTNVEGSRALVQLLQQAVLSLDRLPVTASLSAVEDSYKEESDKKKPKTDFKAATPTEILRCVGRRGIHLTFTPCPMADGKGASSSSGGGGEKKKVFEVDPLVTINCVERYLMAAAASDSKLPSGGMRVLYGSSARHMLEGLSSMVDSASIQELLRRMEEAGPDMVTMEEDDDRDPEDDSEGGSSEGQLLIVDYSQLALYDEPRKTRAAKEGDEDVLSPPISYRLSLDGVPCPKYLTVFEALRRWCIHKRQWGTLRQLNNMFIQQTHDGSIEKGRKHMVSRKSQERKQSSSSTDGPDIWEHVFEMSWEEEEENRPEPSAQPEVFLSQEDSQLWLLDRIIFNSSDLGQSIGDPAFVSVIQLLRLINAISTGWHVFKSQAQHVPPAGSPQPILPPSAMQSPHLTEKLVQTLVSNASRVAVFGVDGAPAWCRELLRCCPFLFPVAARKEIFHFITHGATRSFLMCVRQRNREINLDILQPEAMPSNVFPHMAVDRQKILTKANSLLGATSWRHLPLEVQYENEEGTGLGPTLEFFTITAHELQKSQYKMWRGDTSKEFIESASGVMFPAVKQQVTSQDIALFQMLGRLVARALADGRLVDLPLSEPFARLLQYFSNAGELWVSVADVHEVDPAIGTSLKYLADFSTKYDSETDAAARQALAAEAGLDSKGGYYYFTLPGDDRILLKEGGDTKCVTAENVREFVNLACRKMLFDTVAPLISAFKQGFEETLPLSALQMFSESEAVTLVCGEGKPTKPLWTAEELAQTIVPDHGYTSDSRCIQDLIQILANEMTPEEQGAFLQWATGCPRLPLGGLSALGKITVVRKKQDMKGGDDSAHLPSCNTCFRYVKIPTYPTKEMLASKLRQAISEGVGSFNLS